MNKKILETIKYHDMIKKGDKILIALSGGADSMSLAFFLKEMQQVLDIEIFAVHVNHCLRGEEADRDEAFVKKWCENNKIPYFIRRVDIRTLAAQRKQSEELCAREERYKIFSSFGEDIKIATAHNLNDCLETALFNLTRGTTLQGMSGIPPKRGQIIRPLIECTREEIEAYCEEKGIQYVTDSTNKTDDYSRNIIRNNVLPQLRRINPSIEKSYKRFQTQLNSDIDFIDSYVEKIYPLSKKNKSLSADILNKEHYAVRSRIIYRFVDENFSMKLENIHIRQIDDVIMNGGKTMVKNRLIISSLKNIVNFFYDKEKIESPLSIDKIVVTRDDFVNNCEIYKKDFDFFADYDRIKGELFLRHRMAGDKIKLAGRNCTKSLKKLFNELAIPQNIRDSAIVLCDDTGVVAVLGYALSENIKVTNKTQKVLLVRKQEDKYE